MQWWVPHQSVYGMLNTTVRETLRSWHSKGFNQHGVDIQIHMRSKNMHKANKQMNGNQCGVNETLEMEK